MSIEPIVIFDSGIGGLTVVHAVRLLLPHENIIYLGDTARVPYGTKSATTIERYALQAGEALKKFHPKLMIVACNTASAYGLDLLRAQSDFPVLGVIDAGAKAAETHGGPIAILGTRATVASNAYPRVLHQLNTSLETVSLPCPLLVSLAEEGWWEDPITETICRRYMSDIPPHIKTVILGCTHYPVLLPIFKRLRPDLIWVDSGTPLSHEVKDILAQKDVLNTSSKPGTLRLLVTDENSRLQELASKFLGEAAPSLELINL
ncbi:MAG: glutamate racemase [Acidobacteriota bacterium]|jgi:glutamate racemase